MVAVRAPAPPGRPTVLLLHGRGGGERDLLPLAAALGVGGLAPRGPEPQGGGWAWFRHRVIGVPVLESLQERLQEVGRWLGGALEETGVDRPVTAVGFSNGGMMAGALAAAHPELVGAAALLSSAYPLPAEVLAAGGLAGARVFIGTGDRDPFHPVETHDVGVASYRAAGAEVTERLYPGASHEITRRELDDLGAWLG